MPLGCQRTLGTTGPWPRVQRQYTKLLICVHCYHLIVRFDGLVGTAIHLSEGGGQVAFSGEKPPGQKLSRRCLVPGLGWAIRRSRKPPRKTRRTWTWPSSWNNRRKKPFTEARVGRCLTISCARKAKKDILFGLNSRYQLMRKDITTLIRKT